MKRERSPGIKLLMAGLVAVVLVVPLLMVYALVYDRENQSQQAQGQITLGWGGPQTVTGPVLVVPYNYTTTETEIVDGRSTQRNRVLGGELFISPTSQSIESTIDPDRKGYAIYESVVYQTEMRGTATFDMPEDLSNLGIPSIEPRYDQAELRFGVSDTQGLTNGARVLANGETLPLQPGGGPAATGGSGFSTAVDWSEGGELEVTWQYGIRGSQSLSLVPRGGETQWRVTSPWPHPSFTGTIPDEREISAEGFTATYGGITNLKLGERLVNTQDFSGDVEATVLAAEAAMYAAEDGYESRSSAAATSGRTVASIGLTDPVDLYSQVDRAVKYGFLFIGFTFAAYLMFDIVGGARVAAAEYLLTGAGLVLFFVMLLAFAEVWGFAVAYVLASAAIIGLLTAYSAAVLGTWKRAWFIGGLLAGLYALLFVLLSLETFALVIGSLLLFFALAGIMYATRRVDWSAVGKDEDSGEGYSGIPA